MMYQLKRDQNLRLLSHVSRLSIKHATPDPYTTQAPHRLFSFRCQPAQVPMPTVCLTNSFETGSV